VHSSFTLDACPKREPGIYLESTRDLLFSAKDRCRAGALLRSDLGSTGPGSRHPDLPLLAQCDLGASEALFVSFALIGLDLGQDSSESFVGHNVALGHAPEFIEGAERQTASLVPDLDPAIGGLGARLDQVDPASVVDRQLAGDLSIFLPGEDPGESSSLQTGR
jgi:hypothetical protein